MGWLGTLWPLVAHNLNQQQAMQRAVQAQAQGLPPEAYGTVFPGSTVTTNTTTTNNTGGGLLRGALLSAALLASGGAATLGVLKGLPAEGSGNAARRGEASTPAAAPPPAAPGKGKEWDALYEVRQPDGSWKAVRRERLKTRE